MSTQDKLIELSEEAVETIKEVIGKYRRGKSNS